MVLSMILVKPFREHTCDDNRAHGHDSGTADSTDSSSNDDHPHGLSDAAVIVSIMSW